MQIFHELIEEVFLTGNVSLIGKIQWIPVLGNFDALRFMVIADQVSGSSLSLTVALYETPDITFAKSAFVKNVVNGVVPVSGQSNVYQGYVALADLAPAS